MPCLQDAGHEIVSQLAVQLPNMKHTPIKSDLRLDGGIFSEPGP